MLINNSGLFKEISRDAKEISSSVSKSVAENILYFRNKNNVKKKGGEKSPESTAKLKDKELSPLYSIVYNVNTEYNRALGLIDSVFSKNETAHNLHSVFKECIRVNKLAASALLADQGVVAFDRSQLPQLQKQETPSDEPSWMAEVRALRASGVIPDYQGKRIDGDAYEFYKKHYGPWLDVMNQQALRDLNSDAFISRLAYSARIIGCTLSKLVKPATKKRLQ